MAPLTVTAPKDLTNSQLHFLRDSPEKEIAQLPFLVENQTSSVNVWMKRETSHESVFFNNSLGDDVCAKKRDG